MQIQCEHEYVLDGGIDIYKFDSHWYHRQTYDRMFPNMASVFPPTQFGQETMGQPDDGEDYPENDNGGDDDATSGMPETNNGIIETSVQDNQNRNEDETGNPDNSTPLMPCTSQIVTYQHIQERSSELARTCQNDQPKMRTILSNLNQMIERVRDGHDIFINFDSSYVNMELDTASTNTNIPRSAITKSIPNATGVKRMRSGREYFSRNKKKHRKNIVCSQVINSNDDRHMPPPNSKGRSCLICRQKGHGKGRCPLITKFGTTPLEKDNMPVCHRLSRNLSSISKFQLESRVADDARTVFTELPGVREIKALIIHR
jgi:hypothetical protein